MKDYAKSIRNVATFTTGGLVGLVGGLYYWASSVDSGLAGFGDSGTLLAVTMLFGTLGIAFVSLAFWGEKKKLNTKATNSGDETQR